MKTINRALLLLALVFSIVLASCEAIPSTLQADDLDNDIEAISPDDTLVVYWHTLTGSDQERLLEMIDAFNAGNEWGITVVGEYQGDSESLYAKIVTGLSTNQLPSLVMTDSSLTAAYASREIAVALAPYLESRRWGFTPAELEDFYSSALPLDRLPQFKGQIYSLPACRSLQVLYYNVDWLKELGYDAPPQTWEAFREMACAASKPAEDLHGFEFGMDSALFATMLATHNAPLLNQDASVYTLGGEQGRGTLTYLQDLVTQGCALWEPEEGSHLSDFVAGQVLFAIDSTTELPALQTAIVESANFGWSLSVLPHETEEPLVGVHGASTAILRRTPREQLAAWLFLKWMAEPAQQAKWSRWMACFPVRRSAFGEMAAYLETHPQYSLAAGLLEQTWVGEPNVTAYPVCRAEIGRMLYAVTAGESVDQWFNNTQSFCNQSLVEIGQQTGP